MGPSDIAGTAMGAPKTDIKHSWGSGYALRLLDRLVRNITKPGSRPAGNLYDGSLFLSFAEMSLESVLPSLLEKSLQRAGA